MLRWVTGILSAAMVLTACVLPVGAEGSDIANFTDAQGNVHYLWQETSGNGWSYDERSHTLTLNGISGTSLFFLTNTWGQELKVVLNGNNQLEWLGADGYDLVFDGSGTLTLTGKAQVNAGVIEGTEIKGTETLLCEGKITVNSGVLNVSPAQRGKESGPIYYAIGCDEFVMNGGTVNIQIPDLSNSYYDDIHCSNQSIHGGTLNSDLNFSGNQEGTYQEQKPAVKPEEQGERTDNAAETKTAEKSSDAVAAAPTQSEMSEMSTQMEAVSEQASKMVEETGEAAADQEGSSVVLWVVLVVVIVVAGAAVGIIMFVKKRKAQ